MLEVAYEGHQGQVKTKQLWFPGMDDQCKKLVSICIYCQANTLKTHREPLKMTELPETPWKRVTLDFCGPLTNVNLALVFHCYYARYPVVEFAGCPSEKTTIPVITWVFQPFGILGDFKSDNGPPLTVLKLSIANMSKKKDLSIAK